MSARVLVNGDEGARIAANDRGLLYGDGLFETILFANGAAPLWLRHVHRLLRGCERLGLPAPDPELLAREAGQVVVGMQRAVVRMTLTRGTGARGYAPPQEAECTRIVAAFDPPFIPTDWYARGIRVRFGELRLATQPRLAGIKHLNRLEQVLAQAEWQDESIVDGLMLDTEGEVVSSTASNVFLVRGGVLVTPDLRFSGVLGVMRAEVLRLAKELGIAVSEEPVWPRDVEAASEVFITNAVRGIRSVTELGALRWTDAPIADRLREALDF